MITHDSQDPTPRHLTREAIEQELALSKKMTEAELLAEVVQIFKT